MSICPSQISCGVSGCTSARVENDTQFAKDKQHTQESHMPTSPAQYTCDYMGYVRHVGHAVRKQQKPLVITWARTSQDLTSQKVE